MRIPNEATIAELRRLGAEFLKAGAAYWEVADKAQATDGMVSMDDPNIGLVVFAKGEHEIVLRSRIPEWFTGDAS